ncbi:MAG: hypothetical protein HC834_03280 [Rhodospirillales bacterium]|nr:hypothetical protein [Rhodospirillales bacterium]
MIGVKDALTGKDDGLSVGETGAFKRMLPYNNLWLWDWILRPTFEEVAR